MRSGFPDVLSTNKEVDEVEVLRCNIFELWVDLFIKTVKPMIVLKKLVDNGNVWNWLLMTMLPSSLPFLVSILMAFGTTPIPLDIDAYIKVSDVIFIGLSLSISNLNAWRMESESTHKTEAFFCSISGLIIFSISLVYANSAGGVSVFLKIFIVIIIIALIRSSVKLEINHKPQTNDTPNIS